MECLRRATPNDAEELAAVHLASWRAAYRGIVPEAVFKTRDIAYRTVRFREFLTTDEGETYLVERAGLIAGFMTLGACRDADANAKERGEIWGIYLRPSSWRRGIGTRLSRFAETWFRERGYPDVTLWVLERNTAARRFYEARGFEPDGAVKELALGIPLLAVRYRKTIS